MNILSITTTFLLVITGVVHCEEDPVVPGECFDVPSYESYQSIINSTNDKLVVVKIETKTCRGCQYLAPGLDELANAYPDQLIILNADYKIVPEPMYEFNCKRVPTIVVYYQGTVVDGPYVSTNITEIEEHLEKLSYLVV